MKNNTLLYATIALCISGIAHADTQKFNKKDSFTPFVGLKSGMQWMKDSSYKGSAPSSPVFGVFSGLQFNNGLSWDVGYQNHGKMNAKSIDVKLSLIETAVKYDWYLQKNISLYSRLGGVYWDMKKEGMKKGGMSKRGMSPLIEGGISYTVSDDWNVSAGYQYIDSIGGAGDLGTYDSNALVVSLSHSFGHTSTPTVKKTVTPPAKPIVVKKQKKAPVKPIVVKKKKVAHEIIFRLSANFKPNRANIKMTPAFLALLDKLKKQPSQYIHVTGYTDSIGSYAYNKKLSKRRAFAVTKALVAGGINKNRIITKGRGESNPIASNMYKTGRIKNRRVDIYLSSFDKIH